MLDKQQKTKREYWENFLANAILWTSPVQYIYLFGYFAYRGITGLINLRKKKE